MITQKPQHNDQIALKLTLGLLLLLALTSQAQGSSSSSIWQRWRSRSLLSDSSADEDDSSSSSSSTTVVQLVAVLAPPATANSSATGTAIGSNLHASDQCGGAGGLCNQTTIGIPCGDHAWQSVYCPQNFTCTRRNASYWKCTLLPGRTPPSDAHFNGSAHLVPVVQLLPQSISGSKGQPGSQQLGNAADSSSSGSSSKDGGSDEPIVPVCGPDTLKGPNRMCNRTSHYILPLDRISAADTAATSAAGSCRADRLRSTAAQLLRLGAALLAAAAGSAALGI